MNGSFFYMNGNMNGRVLQGQKDFRGKDVSLVLTGAVALVFSDDFINALKAVAMAFGGFGGEVAV